jgi:AcrR family transcriptional regulator
MNQAPSPQQPGLRERKKARTRAAIREHALRLFRQQGYDATTVEQIAEAADVSPSTFFRYFTTKEDVVLQDELDVLAIGAFEAQPADLSPVAAFRAAAREAFASLGSEELARLRETAELTLTVPELRARAMDEFARTIGVIAEAVARRSGRDPDDFAVRVLAGAVVGVIMAATMPWEHWAAEDLGTDMLTRIDAALCQLEDGLPLRSVQSSGRPRQAQSGRQADVDQAHRGS